MLRWIHGLPERLARPPNARITALIDGILNRRLYKRVATLPRETLGKTADALDNLSWPKRVTLCEKVQGKIHEAIRNEWGALDTTPMTTLDEVDRLFKGNLAILIDIPAATRSLGFNRPLITVPELKEKSYYQESQAEEAKNWEKSLESLWTSISPIRVLCHESLRQTVTSSIRPSIREGLREVIENNLPAIGR